MKKVLSSLFMAIVCLPVFAQIDAGHVVKHIEKVSCTPYTWSLTSETYNRDTTVMTLSNDTIYILDLTINTTGNVTVDSNIYANCVYIWRDSLVWKQAGLHSVTVTDNTGCDSIYNFTLTLGNSDTTKATVTVCDSYRAPWGEVFTNDTIIDTVYTTAEGCLRSDTLHLTVNHSIVSPTEMIDTTCSYTWRGRTITDTQLHYDTVHNARRCDSIFSIQLNLSYQDQEAFDTTVCDKFIASWGEEYTTSQTISHTATSGLCTTTTTIGLTVNHGSTDTLNAPVTDITAGCFYSFGGSVFTDTNTVHRAILTDIHGCDSAAAIRIVAYTNINLDSISVTPCAHPYRWHPADSLFVINESGLYADSSFNATTGCKTQHRLLVSFEDSTAVINRPRRCLHDEVRLVSGTPIIRFETAGEYSMTEDEQGNPLTHYVASTQCRTNYTVNLNIFEANVDDRYDTVVACDSYLYARTNTTFTSDTPQLIDTVLIKSTRPSAASYVTNSNHATSQCKDARYFLNLTINNSTVDTNDVRACDSYTWSLNDSTYYRDTTLLRRTTDSNEVKCPIKKRLILSIAKTPTAYITGEWMLEPNATTTLTATSNVAEDIVAYAWFVNGDSVANGNTYEVSDQGDHENIDIRLKTSNGNGCPANNYITITFTNIGIENAEEINVNIYPNPATQYVNISTDEALSQIVVYNNIGQQVMLQETNGNNVTMDLQNLSNGNYTMRIITTNGEVATRKFIISK